MCGSYQYFSFLLETFNVHMYTLKSIDCIPNMLFIELSELLILFYPFSHTVYTHMYGNILHN